MKKIVFLLFVLYSIQVKSQTNNNGQLDLITELSTVITVPFTMPDGVKLETDIYLPIISDSIVFNIGAYTIELIPKGTQLIIYDSIGNTLNTNKYQLPMIFTRTPYGKGSESFFGLYLNILGYGFALQDMRGRYNSEGVYLPMYSDNWDKNVYHPNSSHLLDITTLNDPSNGNFHEDGKNSIQFIMDSLYKYYDLDGDGIEETHDLIYNGSIVMFGASALGNTQYQAASSIKNDVSQDGLKGLLPIVATNEYYNSVFQHNGVYREGLVSGWLSGQLNHNNNVIPTDNDIQNNIHSIFDYGNIDSDTVIKRGLDHVVVRKDANGVSGMYPNNLRRADGDASFAMVNSFGESDLNGTKSRYTNLELPMYHVTGWWDIFIDGQIDTYNKIMENTSIETQQNQKIVIGPWTHGTIAQDTVTDLIFPSSVFDLNLINYTEALNGNLSELFDGEMIEWFRYLLNYETGKELGEPKIMIPESNNWQEVDTNLLVRIPSEDFYITYADFLNFIGGNGDLSNIPYELNNTGTITINQISIPSANLFPFDDTLTNPISESIDFTEIPNFRYYVPGPIDDGEVKNTNVGNYWTSAETFPLNSGVEDYTLYLHSNGNLNKTIPDSIEPFLSYEHNPDSPVITLGGGNLTLSTPQGNTNAGPMDYSEPSLAAITMNRADVLKFETDFIEDSLSIVGIPKAIIYASTSPLSGPNGETDTDFFIRILDVYPNGREIFVVEGAVNARARDYAKLLSNGIEDINIPFTNINPNEIYEYEFNLLPIAYTFGHNHKIKVLISSSNWKRYQVNANIPIETGEFFRHEPNDGQTYEYNSTVYSPRIAEQKIFFSDANPSQIILPFFGNIETEPIDSTISIKESTLVNNEWFVYPNPAKGYINIELKNKISKTSKVDIINLLGRKVFSIEFNNKTIIDTKKINTGLYYINIKTGNETFLKKISIL